MTQSFPTPNDTSQKTSHDEPPGLLGIWDLEKAPFKLGKLILFVAELHAQALWHTAGISGICFVGDISQQLSPADILSNEHALMEMNKSTYSRSVLLSTLLSLKGVDTCYWAPSLYEVKHFIDEHPGSFMTWPSIERVDKDGHVDYEYGTTIFLQSFYRKNGHIPLLSMKPKMIKWALHFIEDHIAPSLPVVIHLKNNPLEQGCSNANFDVWLTFFKSCLRKYPVKFILIGNEEVDERIRKLPNVILTQELGSTLARDLALIQIGIAFFGMSSGPCNMAIFNKEPYIIYKHPDHHAEKMKIELGQSDHFPFAVESQKFLREYETLECLMTEFTHIYNNVDRKVWERKILELS